MDLEVKIIYPMLRKLCMHSAPMRWKSNRFA